MTDKASYQAYPHQVDASLFALDSPLSIDVILADEGGLGKTIEASLVIAQFETEEVDDWVRNGKAADDHKDVKTVKPVSQKWKHAGGERADG